MKRKDIHWSFKEENCWQSLHNWYYPLHCILTNVSSLAFTLDEWCGVISQHEFCAQQGCAQAIGPNVPNVRSMRSNWTLTKIFSHQIHVNVCKTIGLWTNQIITKSSCCYKFFLPCFTDTDTETLIAINRFYDLKQALKWEKWT